MIGFFKNFKKKESASEVLKRMGEKKAEDDSPRSEEEVRDRESDPNSRENDLREGLKRFRLLQAEVVKSYKEAGLPLTETMRLKYEWFQESGFYAKEEIQEDMAYAEDRNALYDELHAEDSEAQEELRAVSGFSEEIIPVIFHLALKTKGFSVFRSVESDDFRNGIDLQLVLKESGRAICSFDATNSNKAIVHGLYSKDSEKPSKLEAVVMRNKRGVRMKYSATLGKDGKFYPASIEKSRGVPPLVHLIIPRKRVDDFLIGLAKVDKDKISSYCDIFAEELINSLYESLGTIRGSLPDQAENIDELTEILQQETGVDPSLAM